MPVRSAHHQHMGAEMEKEGFYCLFISHEADPERLIAES